MYEKLSPAALKDMFIGAVIGLVIAEAVILGLLFGLFMPMGWQTVCVIAVAAAVFVAVFSLTEPVVRYNRYRYKIDDESIDIVEGYIFVTRNIVPVERLHKLQISRGPIDRLCGLSKVSVTTAGGDVTIRFLEDEKAERIAESLKIKINAVSREQKSTQLKSDLSNALRSEKNTEVQKITESADKQSKDRTSDDKVENAEVSD